MFRTRTWIPALLALMCFLPLPSSALLLDASFTGTGFGASPLSASARFMQTPEGHLLVRLSNDSAYDLLYQRDVLTAVFFDLSRPVALTSAHASVQGIVLRPGFETIGENWGYKCGFASGPGGARRGISSAGLGLFSFGTFDPANPSHPLGGIDFGLTSSRDDPATHAGNQLLLPLVQSGMLFDLGQLGTDPVSVQNVSFQYGTSRSDPNLRGMPVAQIPEPTTLAAMALMVALAGAAAWRRRK